MKLRVLKVVGSTLAAATAASAQVNISTVTTTVVSTGSQTRTGLTAAAVSSPNSFSTVYNGNELRITNFTAGSDTFVPVLSGVAYARRNTSTPNFPTVNGPLTGQWNAVIGTPGAPTNGSTRTVQGRYYNTMETLFTSQNLWTGTENLFVNDDTVDVNPGNGTNVVNNIERMDFVFSTGLSVTADLAFAIFERGRGVGGNGANGGFKVAVITGIDGSGVPTSYANLIQSVTDNNYGTTNLPAVRYDVYRNDTISSIQLNFLNNPDIGPQGVAGSLFRPSDWFLATFGGIAPFSLVSRENES